MHGVVAGFLLAQAHSVVGPTPKCAASSGEAALGRVEEMTARHGSGVSAESLVAAAEPALLRGTAVDGWPARRWSWEHLRAALEGTPLAGVVSTTGHLYLQPDAKAALAELSRETLETRPPHSTANLSAADFFARATPQTAALGPDLLSDAARRSRRSSPERLVHFGAVPEALKPQLGETGWLYTSTEDEKRAMQYTWLSTPGVRTHTHFDSDPNFFVQLVGQKR